ncbi:putative elongation factor TypA SVR3, chloroplastic [Trifolium repens]|nr:putative elongation factor TypA SVR3, chloroplastic [Trifolium repens]
MLQIATVEVPEERMGVVVELLGKRREQMFDMQGVGYVDCFSSIFIVIYFTTKVIPLWKHVKYKIPTHGLLGLRNAILTASRGTTILNTVSDMSTRDLGSMVAFEGETGTSYAMQVHRRGGNVYCSRS